MLKAIGQIFRAWRTTDRETGENAVRRLTAFYDRRSTLLNRLSKVHNQDPEAKPEYIVSLANDLIELTEEAVLLLNSTNLGSFDKEYVLKQAFDSLLEARLVMGMFSRARMEVQS